MRQDREERSTLGARPTRLGHVANEQDPPRRLIVARL
jgi:hypothetical protein